ncbi:hypothetical protein V8G54_034052 [Vigna mungo]|uniref:Proteasome activator Blm10 middle HEAT repeats region domain-containing protein n=1 Tax=Vigna mungo TaxID=3915 RepID=A0AAQ3MQW4_VIGMU
MHLYNAWLPPPVAAQTAAERDSFTRVIAAVKSSFRPDDPESVFSTLKFISVLDLFFVLAPLGNAVEFVIGGFEGVSKTLRSVRFMKVGKKLVKGLGVENRGFVTSFAKYVNGRIVPESAGLTSFIIAKSDVSLEDVRDLAQMGLEIFHVASNKLYAQGILNYIPVAEVQVQKSCRRFFPSGSAFEIWSEFKSLLQNPWHNSSFEGSGFARLFLPTNLDNEAFFTHDWITECIDLWESIPNCQFWNNQWADVIARVVKNYHNVDWDCFLPLLFARYLNMFEILELSLFRRDQCPRVRHMTVTWSHTTLIVSVDNRGSGKRDRHLRVAVYHPHQMPKQHRSVPVANGSGSHPFSLDVPRNTRFLFSNKTSTPTKAISKSIVSKYVVITSVYLLKPGSPSQQHFEKLINILEQFILSSLKRGSMDLLLGAAFVSFGVSISKASTNNRRPSEQHLGESERVFFVNSVLKLIDRGQYSKNEHLSETVAAATSILSYVEPSLVLPFVASRFHMALETMTATHQLKIAVMSVAFVGRSLFYTSVSACSTKPVDLGVDLVGVSLSNALLGMDANDPPKTLATMQLIGSIFSNLALLDDKIDDLSFMPMVRFSEWLDEFLCRLFSLLQHLEPSSVINEGLQSSATTGTFLVDDGPYYFCVLEILFGRLSNSLYNQALKKISNFVKTNILPGAVAEVGLLCCACVHSNPEEAVSQLVEPILLSVISSLKGTPRTGFGGGGTFEASASSKAPFLVRSTISPALEAAIDYQLKILSVCITYGGPALLRYKAQFKEAVFFAFDSPSWKVNGAADHLLRSLLGSQIHYYPIDQYNHPDAVALEEWISTKGFSTEESFIPKWHIPCDEEIHFANELIDIHFQSALDDLLKICQSKIHADQGDEKEHLKVTLLRIESTLQGLFSCLPDFVPNSRNGTSEDSSNLFLIAGATGCTVGSTALREKAAEIIHIACKYVLEKKSDDSILLILIIRIIDALGNYGTNFCGGIRSLEFDEWSSHRQAWKLESAAIIEPPINFIVSSHSKGKKRPRWALIDKAFMHSTWRSSQASYHLYRTSGNFCPSDHVTILMDDLLTLSLHSYETVRLLDLDAEEYAVLGSCSVLASQTVLKHLTTDPKSFSSFILAILSSSHHESLKAQKAINELFVKYNIQFSGVSRSFFRISDKENQTGGLGFSDLVSQIGSMSFDSTGLHWR